MVFRKVPKLGILVLQSILLLFCMGRRIVAQSVDQPEVTCSTEGYRIITPQLLGIQCIEDISASSLGVTNGTVVEVGGQRANTGSTATVEHWWILVPIPADAKLKPNANYSVSLKRVSFLDPAAGKNQANFSFSTSETATVAPSIVDSQSRQYEVTSNLAFLSKTPGERTEGCKLLYEDASRRRGAESQAKEVLPATSDRPKELTAGCHYLNDVTLDVVNLVAREIASSNALTPATADQLTGVNGLAHVGQVTVILANPLHGNFPAMELPTGLEGLKDVFDHPLKTDPKSKFKSQKAPSTKSDAQWYLNMNYAGGVGSKPAWAADVKVAPRVGPLEKGFQFSPLVTADIGHNTISGITYTDMIDMGVSAARVFMRPSSVLQEILFTPGVTYETDREFDRDNLLATTDLRFNFAHLYSPQSTRSLQRFGKDRGNNPSLTPDQEPLPFLGYALDFHLGTETGDALVDTTVKATTGTASRTLPAYAIARLVPQIHGLLQLGPVSLDCTGTERYLATTENTVVQLQNNHLILEHLTGWKGYGVLTATFKPDQTGHLGITLTYKNGFAPPKFQRVNTVQAGVLLIY
jgi:hypothetical protein